MSNMSPKSGRMLKEDGTYINVADALSTDEPGIQGVEEQIGKYAPMSGRMIREDGSVINIADLIAKGGIGGGGGTENYNDLSNKPQINGVELSGNKTAEGLGLQLAGNYLTDESDPTVAAWAKEETKPEYTADEVGAVAVNQGAENAGKIMIVGADGNVTPQDVKQKNLEKAIKNYYALRRTGKVYQTKFWKFAENPTSAGEKLLDNAGLVFSPSTDTEEGQSDYLNGQHPLFEWVRCNYIRDDDGTARPTAIERTEGYKTTGAVDVGAMQMSFYFRWDASNAEYDLITISDLPHSELGLEPWVECAKADGTVVPWCIGSAYVSSVAEDGKLRSQPGKKPERNQSHNSMITNYQAKGTGYRGAGACRNVFQFIFNAIKGVTKNSQTLYAGCTSYNYQYEAAVQSEDAHTYFPVTKAQAANLVAGSYVSVGYGANNNGTANIDRGQAFVHAYADDVKILSIETLDENNMAVYLDIPEEDAFNTQPHVYTEDFSAPIILSTMHWWSGATDAVKGRNDGSPGSNTNGKYPYRVQGREYAVGAYIVASDTVMDLQADYTKKVLVAPKGVAHSSSETTIRSTYTEIGTIPAAAAGDNADWWIGDIDINTDSGSWYPKTEGSGSSQGTGDRVYAGGATATSGMREYLQGGNLGVGSVAGSSFLGCWGGLGWGSWDCAACD